MPILVIRNIRKSFGQTVALDGVDLSLKKGEVHALIGENGAGKSTLMNLLSGVIQPDSGIMELGGKAYKPANTTDARRNRIALIHQELSLAPHLTVAQNIMMGVETSRFGWLDRKALFRRAGKVLENFDHPDIRPEKTVGSLSTAAQQVVEICRAIAARAEIILMDEPTSSLQRDDVQHLFRLIRKLSADGVSIIYISHFLEEIRDVADRYTVLRDGRTVASGKIAEVTDDLLISQMVGRPVDMLFPPRKPPAEPARNLVEVRDLSAPPVLKNASFELKAGEILGIAGLIGAGRSEMVKAIFGLERSEFGKLSFAGNPLSPGRSTPTDRIRQGFGYLSEDRKREGLALDLSIADNITMTGYSSCSKFGWLNLRRQRGQSEELIKGLGIRAQTPTQPVMTLSGGNQQKAAIARLIHQKADVLLLDEPTRGIDIGSRSKIYEIIAELASSGKAILMISSYLPELFGMCDRLAVMRRGRLSPIRPISDWTPELVMQVAIEGEDPLSL